MTDREVAVIETLDGLYPNLGPEARELQCQRVERIKTKFSAVFEGRNPSFFVRAPGRVNLIGEHVDYSGFPVLPMALVQDAIVAVHLEKRERGGDESEDCVITIANSIEKYAPKPFLLSHLQDPTKALSSEWTDYFLGALRGLQDKEKDTNKILSTHFSSIQLYVDGSVPIGSGLSSSASMVCSYTLALVYLLHLSQSSKVADDLLKSRASLGDLCAQAERYTGVETGGMDQAISFLAKANEAQLISFVPHLSGRSISLPSGVSFVIAHSCREHQLQASDSGSGYNMRVVECRLASALLARHLLPPEIARSIRTLRQLQDALEVVSPGDVGATLEGLLESSERILKEEPFQKNELVDLLQLSSLDELDHLFMGSVASHPNPQLYLRKRAVHVFSESIRVQKFYSLCSTSQEQKDAQIDDVEKARLLGQLMNQSHESCRDFFECSCPELDNLTDLARRSGAFGSRLTGAGWGGCSISLVPTPDVPRFLDSLRSSFYRPGDPETRPCNPDQLPDRLFVTQPGEGASVFVPN